MPNTNAIFTSKYARARDLKGSALKVEIAGITKETVGNKQKLVLYFTNFKPLVCNSIAGYGSEPDPWIGRVIELYPTTADYQGKTYDVIRVRVPPRPAAAAQGSIISPQPTTPILEGEPEIVEDEFADLEPDPEF